MRISTTLLKLHARLARRRRLLLLLDAQLLGKVDADLLLHLFAMSGEVFAQDFAFVGAPVPRLDPARAAVVGLGELWLRLMTLGTPLPFELDDIQNVVLSARSDLSSMQGFHERAQEVEEAHDADTMVVVGGLVLADVLVREGEGAEIRGILESAERRGRFAALKASVVDVDVAEVLAHAADAVDEDL